jgi:hypothetical protein
MPKRLPGYPLHRCRHAKHTKIREMYMANAVKGHDVVANRLAFIALPVPAPVTVGNSKSKAHQLRIKKKLHTPREGRIPTGRPLD